MGVNLYRLFAVQNFSGNKVAVYTNQGNYPDPEILGDAERICRGEVSRTEVIRSKIWLYKEEEPKKVLTFWTRLIDRSRKVIEENENCDKAIFVKSTWPGSWRGTNVLYHNKYFDELKTDTPEFSGCEANGEITL